MEEIYGEKMRTLCCKFTSYFQADWFKKFLTLSEEQKRDFVGGYKHLGINRLTKDMELLWNSPMTEERFYYDD